jgi:hypothetical protein
MPEVPTATITLDRAHFGINPVPLTEQLLDITAPEGQQIKLKTAVWKRQEPSSFPYQQENQAVFVSGFGTRSQDWPVAFEGLGNFYETVVGLDHPDAPTSTITLHDRALNTETFHNSGFVILRAIEAKIKDGTLQEGVNAVGLSTGAPVLLEAVAQDIKESETTGRARYIKSLLLTAPAGLMDRKSFAEIAAGAAGGMGPYMKENYLRDLYFRVFGKLKNGPDETIEARTRTSFKDLCQRIKTAWNKRGWKDIRGMHVGFEIMEYVTQRLPVDTFMEFFHRVWPNQDPHFLPATPSIKRDQELVYKNVTTNARAAIHNTDVRIELYENDKGVPPDGFLNAVDKKEIDEVTLTDPDWERLTKINTQRAEILGSKFKPYSEAWMLQNKKEGLLLDRIIQRVKELFPNNGDHTHVAINIGGNHLTPKVDIDMTADLTVRRMEAEKNKTP